MRISALVGISGSGKSTYAHQVWKENPHSTRIVSYDSLRMSMYGFTEASLHEYYAMSAVGKMEREVIRFADSMVEDFLTTDGVDHIIMDNTHLNERYLTRLKKWNIPIEIHYFDTSIEIAKRWDNTRTKSVGSAIIDKQYSRLLELEPKLEAIEDSIQPVPLIDNTDKAQDCFIFDLDGTLALMQEGGRSPFDWDRVGEDELCKSTAELLQSVLSFGPVLICTGRSEESRNHTLAWLASHHIDIPESSVFFRGKRDFRPDWQVKEDMWRHITDELDYRILGIVDDRNQVCRRARALGLKVYQAERNNF